MIDGVAMVLGMVAEAVFVEKEIKNLGTSILMPFINKGMVVVVEMIGADLVVESFVVTSHLLVEGMAGTQRHGPRVFPQAGRAQSVHQAAGALARRGGACLRARQGDKPPGDAPAEGDTRWRGPARAAAGLGASVLVEPRPHGGPARPQKSPNFANRFHYIVWSNISNRIVQAGPGDGSQILTAAA